MPQWKIRKAEEADAPKIARICYEAYSLCRDWPSLNLNVTAQEWIEASTNLCLQLFGSANDLVIVAEDEAGEIVGATYCRVLGKGLPGEAQRRPLEGRNLAAVAMNDNTAFVESLLGKYGKIFCKYPLPRVERHYMYVFLTGSREIVRGSRHCGAAWQAT